MNVCVSVLTLVFTTSGVFCCQSNVGINSGLKLGDGKIVKVTVKELSTSSNQAAFKLGDSIATGNLTNIMETVHNMPKQIYALANKTVAKIDSPDFFDVGVRASIHLRNGVGILLRNWRLALNMTDLLNFEPEIIQKLAEALEKISMKLETQLKITDHGKYSENHIIVEMRQNSETLSQEILTVLAYCSIKVGTSLEMEIENRKQVVNELKDTVAHAGDRISTQLDSGDLAMLSKEDKIHIRDVTEVLLTGWNVAITSTGLQSETIVATRNLEEALTKIQSRVDLYDEYEADISNGSRRFRHLSIHNNLCHVYYHDFICCRHKCKIFSSVGWWVDTNSTHGKGVNEEGGCCR
ncbi:uncharacterized protein LOC110841615 [Folsomia candida]|uniref:uncharacterized protein LOC110841615 n=1 Tax=Folsomia candida TaxID=158441 RepID=UPI0016053811|nr:uncharacterized protein LOC110841615 [Folsomia candida]